MKLWNPCRWWVALFMWLVWSMPDVSLAGAAPDTCADNLGSPIPNFCLVAPNVLWRGSKPDVAGAAWLIGHGVGSIVNLELLHDDRDTLSAVHLQDQVDDRDVLKKAGVDDQAQHVVSYYVVRDWEPLVVVAPWLTDDHVAQFLAVVEQAPKPVYVHCRSGQNRTGVMVAAYKVIVGGRDSRLDIEQVIADMKGYQGIWFDADAAYIRSLTPEHIESIRNKVSKLKAGVQPEAIIRCGVGGCTLDD